MVYIAPLPGKNEQKQHKTALTGAGRLPKANTDPQQHNDNIRPAGKQARNQRPAPAKGLNVQKSKQDLLQELTRQAEWNTLVLQREQAALQVLQESQTGTLQAQASAQVLAGVALDIIGPPAGLAPVVTKSKNHRFFGVAPKLVDPKQVPGLSTSPAADALAINADWQQGHGSQQQQARMAKLPVAQQQSSVRQQQQPAGCRAAAAAARPAQAAGKQQQQQQGRNAQRQRQPAPGGKAAASQTQAAGQLRPRNDNAAAAGAAPRAAAWQEQDAAGIDSQLSPFAAADWRFEYPDAGPSQTQHQQGMLGQTFPDSPQFRSGMVFDIPAGAGLSADGQYAVEPYSSAGAAAAAPQMGHLVAASYAGANIPLVRLVEQQQQQQGNGWLAPSDDQSMPGGCASSPIHAVQHQQHSAQTPLQPHLLLQSCHTLDELAEAMRVAQAYPDPVLRAQLVKELKQKEYKLELEQQIAEREAARQAAKAAAAAREAAEEAARAAAPPPWDPVARAHRLGGGGEPLISIDGMPVADLRGMRGRLPVPGAESSQTFSAAQQQPQLVVHLPAGLSSNQAAQLLQSVGSPPGIVNVVSSVAQQQALHGSAGKVTQGGAAPVAVPAANKGFMSALTELKAGPSIEQRAAAAAARQKLLDDLQSQVAEKAARAAADAAAEADKTAREEEALQRYYTQQQTSANSKLHQSCNPQGIPSQTHQVPNSQPWAQTSGAVGLGQAGAGVGLSGSASNQAMLQALAEASNRVLNAGSAAGAESGGNLPRKGRSKKVIEAPWLDQLQQQQGQSTQQQQQHCQPGLAAQPSSYSASVQVDCQQQQMVHSSLQHSRNTALGTLQQSVAAAVVADAAAAAEQLSSQQLAAALQELQQQQTLMWEQFTWQTKALERLLENKQASVADSNIAWAELQRVRIVLQQAQEQQRALQQMLDDRQQHNGAKGRRQGQQQEHDALLTQQHSTVQVNSMHQQQHQLGQSMSDELHGDSLDALMVETQLVPVSVNTIPESVGVGDSLMQLMLPPLVAGGNNPRQPVQHCNRYATYGLDGELSSCSIASNMQQGKASARGSSSAAWGAWPNSQQPLSHRPPASPPILRSDRFADKPADSNAAEGNASHRRGKASCGGSSGPANKTKSRIAAAGGAKNSARRRI